MASPDLSPAVSNVSNAPMAGVRKPVISYPCTRCNKVGHNAKYCPTQGDPKFDPEIRLLNIPRASKKRVASLEGIDSSNKTVGIIIFVNIVVVIVVIVVDDDGYCGRFCYYCYYCFCCEIIVFMLRKRKRKNDSLLRYFLLSSSHLKEKKKGFAVVRTSSSSCSSFPCYYVNEINLNHHNHHKQTTPFYFCSFLLSCLTTIHKFPPFATTFFMSYHV